MCTSPAASVHHGEKEFPSETTALDTRKLENISLLNMRSANFPPRDKNCLEILVIKRNVSCRSLFALNLEVFRRMGFRTRNPAANLTTISQTMNCSRSQVFPTAWSNKSPPHSNWSQTFADWSERNLMRCQNIPQNMAPAESFHLQRQVLWCARNMSNYLINHKVNEGETAQTFMQNIRRVFIAALFVQSRIVFD